MGSQTAKPLRCASVGEGETIVLLHGYGLQPETYLPMAKLLADRVRVVIPAVFALPERWTFEHALDCLELTLDELGAGHVTLLGHSFGGGLELGLACRTPERVRECVFSDTLGVHREFGLAWEAVHPVKILRMATPLATSSFVRSWVTHPVQLATAGLWAFFSNRAAEIEFLAESEIECHVMWAARDTVLSRKDGMEFARLLGADFTPVNPPPDYGPVDHDWMFDDPELFVQHLEKLGLQALSAEPVGGA